MRWELQVHELGGCLKIVLSELWQGVFEHGLKILLSKLCVVDVGRCQSCPHLHPSMTLLRLEMLRVDTKAFRLEYESSPRQQQGLASCSSPENSDTLRTHDRQGGQDAS